MDTLVVVEVGLEMIVLLVSAVDKESVIHTATSKWKSDMLLKSTP